MKKAYLIWILLFLVLSVVWAVALVYGLALLDFIRFIKPLPEWAQKPFGTAYFYLRGSLIPFLLAFGGYVYLIFRIRLELKEIQPDFARLLYYERFLNLVISIFFGIGVIWTAIGMQDALVQSLSGWQSETGGPDPRATPLAIMDRLVNGGLLVALWTTIIGGGAGYILRVVKVWVIGSKWDEVFLRDETS